MRRNKLSKKIFNVGVIGFGTIGTGVVRILLKDVNLLARRSGAVIKLKKVADLNFVKKEGIDFKLFERTDDAQELINDSEIDIIVEVIGGVNPAKNFIEAALKKGKHVVTANKELMAKHGRQLLSLAKENKVNLYFEAAVGGGIPIIHAMLKSLAANNFKKVYGILNGTTNYILSKMYYEGADYKTVLKEAQELGYAESDPTSDVEGHDVAYKLTILASIAFDTFFSVDDIYREGISKISARDIEVAKEYGSVIKLLAIGKSLPNDKIELRVHPVMLDKSHPLAAVNDSFNAVYAVGDNVDETMFYGRGAGELPTASAIVGDIIDIVTGSALGETSPALSFGQGNKVALPMGEAFGRYFLRLVVNDKPGVLAAISKIFGDNEVSIRAVQQKDSLGADAEIIIITHAVKEACMQKAIIELKKQETIIDVCSLIRAGL